jgi:hypothetical protein
MDIDFITYNADGITALGFNPAETIGALRSQAPR